MESLMEQSRLGGVQQKRVEQDRTELENQNKYMCKEKKRHIENDALNTSPECIAWKMFGQVDC